MLPNKLATIPRNCFFGAGIVTAIIPSTTEVIEKSAFECCANLETVTFDGDSKLREIRSSAFSACRRLKNINLPAGL